MMSRAGQRVHREADAVDRDRAERDRHRATVGGHLRCRAAGRPPARRSGPPSPPRPRGPGPGARRAGRPPEGRARDSPAAPARSRRSGCDRARCGSTCDRRSRRAPLARTVRQAPSTAMLSPRARSVERACDRELEPAVSWPRVADRADRLTRPVNISPVHHQQRILAQRPALDHPPALGPADAARRQTLDGRDAALTQPERTLHPVVAVDQSRPRAARRPVARRLRPAGSSMPTLPERRGARIVPRRRTVTPARRESTRPVERRAVAR